MSSNLPTHQLNYSHSIMNPTHFFYHRCCYSPIPSTWYQAIKKGVFATWPGLTCQAVDKYLDKSLVSTKGYLRQSYQGVRLTPTPSTSLDETHRNLSTPYNECLVKINHWDDFTQIKLASFLTSQVGDISTSWYCTTITLMSYCLHLSDKSQVLTN